MKTGLSDAMTGLGDELEEIKGERHLRNEVFELTKDPLSSVEYDPNSAGAAEGG